MRTSSADRIERVEGDRAELVRVLEELNSLKEALLDSLQFHGIVLTLLFGDDFTSGVASSSMLTMSGSFCAETFVGTDDAGRGEQVTEQQSHGALQLIPADPRRALIAVLVSLPAALD